MKAPRHTNHFARRMIAIVLLASIIAITALISSLMVFDNLSSRALLQNRLSTLADVVGRNSTAALNFDDRTAAAEVLQALHAEPQVIVACLYDNSGRLFASYRRDDSYRCFSDVVTAPPGDSRFSVVVRPVLRRTERVGTLMVASDLSELNARWRRLLSVAVGLGMLALAIGGVSGSLLQRRVSGPILSLAQAMQEVTSAGLFDTRVEVSGTEEIKELGRGFNTMLAELQRREKEKKCFQSQLQLQASNDALTGLPNRRLFADRLAQNLAVAQRENRTLALLYIDLDGFKLVNDSLGHATGDALLVQVASRLQSRVRLSDTLARLGGDEFTVILGSLHTREEAMLVARVLLEVLAMPFTINGQSLTIGASIGISIFPTDATDPSDLMQQADSAMYAAKRNGKNCATFFTAELGSLVRERLNLENQLRNAIACGQITVHYQPEFDVRSRRLTRFEALARWTHPTLGEIPPTKFIPIAEESGLIVPLGAYILEPAPKLYAGRVPAPIRFRWR
ncbi:MAG: diguanylate cyclase [Acidobacteriales bacterium]|nr:diguanylate cyclase [Terriglobales bacterium]